MTKNSNGPLEVGQMMTAGAIFDEPEDGDRRIVIGDVHTFDPDNASAVDGYVTTRGKLVEEFDQEVGRWQVLCPLVDYRELYGAFASGTL